MPAVPGEDAEWFADAVEQGRTPRSVGDDDLARDLEIVAMLRSRSASFVAQPDPEAKARARARLMGVLAAPGRVLEPAFPVAGGDTDTLTEQLPRVTLDDADDTEGTEGTEGTDGVPTAAARPGRHNARHSLPSRPAGRARAGRGPVSGTSRRRFALVGSAALVMAMALAGAGMLVSRDAVPGDNLYAVKRVAESAGVALAFDDATKARRHLALAGTRLDEVEQLVTKDPEAAAAHPELVTSALEEFDDSAGQGARLLLAGDAAGRDELRTWATAQASRLRDLQPDLPAGAGAEDSLALLDRLVGRAEALDDPACGGTSDAVDDLGPVPARGACAARVARSAAPTADPSPAGTEDPAVAGASDPADPGAGPDPTTAPRSSAGRTAAPRTGGGTTTAPEQDDDPGLLPDLPIQGTPLDGIVGGGSKQPAPSDDGSGGSDDGNDDSSDPPLPGLPSVNLPLPKLPGLGL